MGFLLWTGSGLLTVLPQPTRLGLLGGVGIFAGLRDFGVVHVHLPENRRQVPQDVFAHGLYRAAFQFGFEMGTGVRTYMPATTPYVLAAFILLAIPGVGVALGAAVGFGISRGIVPLTRLLTSDKTVWSAQRDRWGRGLVRWSSAAAAVLALLLASLVWTSTG